MCLVMVAMYRAHFNCQWHHAKHNEAVHISLCISASDFCQDNLYSGTIFKQLSEHVSMNSTNATTQLALLVFTGLYKKRPFPYIAESLFHEIMAAMYESQFSQLSIQVVWTYCISLSINRPFFAGTNIWNWRGPIYTWSWPICKI